jgi:hypothetical protein
MVRLSLGTTRDVALIEGTAQTLAADELSAEIGDAFAVKTGFDPREDADRDGKYEQSSTLSSGLRRWRSSRARREFPG